MKNPKHASNEESQQFLHEAEALIESGATSPTVSQPAATATRRARE